MAWKSPDEIPKESLLPVLPDTVSSLLTECSETEENTRLVAVELRALCGRDLSSALDLILRNLTSKAALTDAVLETRATRTASPKTFDPSLVCSVARTLRGAGFDVTFGPSPYSVAGADLAVGTRGSNGELESFVTEDELWETEPRSQ